MNHTDIFNMQPFDYQPMTPEVIPAYNNFQASAKIPDFPLLKYMVDTEESFNQPGCHSTCSGLIDVSNPNSVYNYNACMTSCNTTGTSYMLSSTRR